MVKHTRLKSLLTGLALYALAAMMIGYFGVNAYTGNRGIKARQDLDQQIAKLSGELSALKDGQVGCNDAGKFCHCRSGGLLRRKGSQRCQRGHHIPHATRGPFCARHAFDVLD